VSALGSLQPKSRDAFRTISEVAADLEVQQHVLRFWESRFAQIKPVKRAGGRRYYRPDDVDLLRGIQALLYVDGLTIRGVQKILKERGSRHVAQIGRGKEPAPFTRAADKVVEKKPEARKSNGHLRAVPSPMSLPFFDASESEPDSGTASVALAGQERVKLKALLSELEGLKKKLHKARRKTL
jgi:DNA-binding transcriptional MerR regulator